MLTLQGMMVQLDLSMPVGQIRVNPATLKVLNDSGRVSIGVQGGIPGAVNPEGGILAVGFGKAPTKEDIEGMIDIYAKDK